MRSRLASLFAVCALTFPVSDMAAAQTPAFISAANELRLCLWENGGLRSAERAGELERGIERYRSESIWAVTETGPGLFRVTRAKPSGMTAEIKLPDDSGAAYCFLFGPKRQAGDAARAADRFVEMGLLQGLQAAEPAAGMQRRYIAPELPFGMELIAYNAEGFGEIVGLTFTGLNETAPSRQLTSGRPEVSRDTVRAYTAWALETCIRNFGNADWMRGAFETGGFAYGWQEGGSSGRHVYFLEDNSLSASVAAHGCEIVTHYIAAPETHQLVRATLQRAYPGQYREWTSVGCGSFGRSGGDMPLVVNVADQSSGAAASCTGAGASRIWFEVPG